MDHNDRNPENESQWEQKAKKNHVYDTSIHELGESYDSASKIGEKQYLALRVYWKTESTATTIGRWLDDATRKEARDFLFPEVATPFSTSWQQYLHELDPRVDKSSNKDIGLWSLVRYFQRSVSSNKSEIGVPSSPKLLRRTIPVHNYAESPFESPLHELTQSFYGLGINDQDPHSPAQAYAQTKAEDEQLVNSALLMFLISVTSYHPKFSARDTKTPAWSLVRKPFQFGLKSQMENPKLKYWTAVTDGYLKMEGGSAMGIVEVKPFQRGACAAKIQKQEAAQMAAWICQFPNHQLCFDDVAKQDMRWRLLISQDADEIYLTFAEYDRQYVDYIHSNVDNRKKKSFMRMVQCGPWSIKNDKHMAQLGEYILAYTLKGLAEWDRSKSTPPRLPTPPQPASASSSSSSDNGESSGIRRQGRSPPGVIRPTGPTEDDLTSVRKKLFTEPTNAPPDGRQQSSAPLRPSHGSGDQPRDASRASADRRQPPPAFLRPSHGSGDRSRDASTSSHSSGNRSRDPSRASADRREHSEQSSASFRPSHGSGDRFRDASRASADRRQQRPSAPPPQNPVLGGNGMGRADGYQGQTSDSLVKKPWYKKL